MKLCIINCDLDDDRTSSLDDRFLVITEGQEILANCVSREIAEKLVEAISGHVSGPHLKQDDGQAGGAR